MTTIDRAFAWIGNFVADLLVMTYVQFARMGFALLWGAVFGCFLGGAYMTFMIAWRIA